MTAEQYVSAAYIADNVLDCGVDTVRRQAQAGTIPGYIVPGTSMYRFLESEVRAALKPAKRGSWVQSMRSRSKRRAA